MEAAPLHPHPDRKAIPDALRQQIIQMGIAHRKKATEIYEELNGTVKLCAIRKVLLRFRKEGHCQARKRGKPRPLALTQEDIKFLLDCADEEPTLTAEDLSGMLFVFRNKFVSRSLVNAVLIANDFTWKQVRQEPPQRNEDRVKVGVRGEDDERASSSHIHQ